MEYVVWIAMGVAALFSYRHMSPPVGIRPSYGFSLVVLVLPVWWLVWFLCSYLPHRSRS